MKLMKKLTIYSFALTILIGFILPILNTYIVSLYDSGDGLVTFLISCLGFLLTFIFLILWQVEVGKRNLVITVVSTGLILFSLVAYSAIKANELEKEYQLAQETNCAECSDELNYCYERAKKVHEKVIRLEDERLELIKKLKELEKE